MRYRLAFTPRAEEELLDLPHIVRKRIARWLELLAEDPRREGTRQLEGQGGLRRVHAGKDYVIVYAISDRGILVLIVRVAHRKDVCRGL